MEEKQKKTTRATNNKKQESKPTTTKTVKKEEKKTTKPVKKTAIPKTTDTNKKDTVKKSVDSEKKKTNTSKKNMEKNPTKTKNEIKQEKVVEIKKEVETKTEQKNNETQNNKYVYISIGTIVCVLIILGLIILNVKLGFHAYDKIKGDKTANSESEFQEQEESFSTTQEIGNVLKKDNETAKQIINKITFSPSITASIYTKGEFDINTIANTLKLKIGWEKTSEDKKAKEQNENNEEVITLKKTTMDDTLKGIFGPDIKCNSESFDYTNTERINYSGGMYTSATKPGEETSIITYQEVQKVVKYSEKIVVYIKTAHINVEDGKCVIYKNFENANLTEKLVEITSEDMFGEVAPNNKTGEGLISLELNSALDSIRNKLNTYKYTF